MTLASADPGRPILGDFKPNNGPLTRWMESIPDPTPIEYITLPGTHDAATWNYTGPETEQYKCQDRSLYDQLDGGIRMLDLRFGYAPDQKTLIFYHSVQVLSLTATVKDVLHGLYRWLTEHPSETLLISLKVDNGPTDVGLQQQMYDLITEDGKKFWSQLPGQLGTLGDARGKAVLLRRFSWADLPSTYPQDQLPGINLAVGFSDNDPDFVIPYNPARDLSAHVEDYYMNEGDDSAAAKVDKKVSVVTSHIDRAASEARNGTDKGAFWLTFASGFGVQDGIENVTPRILAAGDTSSTPGVNAKLAQYVLNLGEKGHDQSSTNKLVKNRLGAIFLDYFEYDKSLVPAIISSNF